MLKKVRLMSISPLHSKVAGRVFVRLTTELEEQPQNSPRLHFQAHPVFSANALPQLMNPLEN